MNFLRLMLVLDGRLCPYANMPSLIRACVAGGVTSVQWRDKHLSDREFHRIGAELLATCRSLDVAFWINDRVDVAMALGADGIHLGQSDLPVHVVRSMISSHMKIGLSAENMDQVRAAQAQDIDYLAISPVFDTTTKNDISKPFGLAGLREVRLFSRHPLIAIGGINQSNAQAVREAGADGIAVVSALHLTNSPREVAKLMAPR